MGQGASLKKSAKFSYFVTSSAAKLSVAAESAPKGVYKNLPFAIYHHAACEAHEIPNHPEQPARVNWIMRYLRDAFPDPDSTIFREAPRAIDDHILLYHTSNHLKAFTTKAARVEAHWENKQRVSYQAYDSDTCVMHGTREAAYRAIGAIVEAIDCVFLPEDDPKHVKTAFCATRPPGHHAEQNQSMGFCFFNNAAIGARYAQQKYGQAPYNIKRVAVLDFDVHHGNGTEDGFKKDPETLFYGSTHEKDNYPGTGADVYPYYGEEAKLPENKHVVNRYLTGGDGKQSYDQFKPRWQYVIDQMEKFRPDLIIFSAGFDAHGADPLGNCWLKTEDFAWATDIVKEAAIRINPEKPVPCVSILEGGYNLGAISESAVAHTQSLIKDRSFEKASNYESKCSDENDLVKEMAKLAVAK